jgi:hypothetical protein
MLDNDVLLLSRVLMLDGGRLLDILRLRNVMLLVLHLNHHSRLLLHVVMLLWWWWRRLLAVVMF